MTLRILRSTAWVGPTNIVWDRETGALLWTGLDIMVRIK